MASDWNGKKLQNDYTEEAGYNDDASLNRTLRYANEIQRDIASSCDWPFLKFKLKKLAIEGIHQIDISPQIPDAPTIKIMASGALTSGRKCKVKITFILFDGAKQEYTSIESEPSLSSNEITPDGENLKIQVLNIPSYDGDSYIEPLTIHRRIYLQQDDQPYFLVGTIEDNDANTFTISLNPSLTIEPPSQSMVEHLSAEDVSIHSGSISLSEVSVDEIQKYDPGMTSKGVPRYYARISETKILLYPAPSSDVTLSYWVKRRPSRIFSDENRAIQLSQTLENVFDIGVNWKWLKYKLDAEWTTMFNLYKDLKSEAKAEKSKKGGQASKVKVVC